MEVLIRYQCPCYPRPKEAWFNVQCSYCKGSGYLQGWVPYSVLDDIQALFCNKL
jgi:hypothetical protein